MKKVTFVISEPMMHEHLSVIYLSAALKKSGHQTSLVFFPTDPRNKDRIVEALKVEEPDLIAFSFMSGEKQHYIDLGRYIKKNLDIPIIVGGPAATFDKRLSEEPDPFDAVCIGEGDLAIVEFVENYRRNNPSGMRNFVVNSNGTQMASEMMDLIEPLDQLPFPDRDILYGKDDFLGNVSVKMFMSGRGCPYQCTYCFNHTYNKMYKGKGNIIRHKSVDYFLEEILQVKKNYPLEGIIFEDDIFIIDKAWLEEFAQKYPRKVGLPYMCYIRPNLVNREVVRFLRESNCYSVRVAVESGNETIRNMILKRNLSNERIISCCNLLHEANIKVQTINMIGLPTETTENMYDTLRLNQLCKPHHVTANMFIPLPGVDITSFAVKEGLLDEDFASPKTVYHSSSMKYPENIKRFIVPFQYLFPLFVMYPPSLKLSFILMRIPKQLLRTFDTLFRLYRNSRFYPPTRISISNKFEALRRYLSYIH